MAGNRTLLVRWDTCPSEKLAWSYFLRDNLVEGMGFAGNPPVTSVVEVWGEAQVVEVGHPWTVVVVYAYLPSVGSSAVTVACSFEVVAGNVPVEHTLLMGLGSPSAGGVDRP